MAREMASKVEPIYELSNQDWLGLRTWHHKHGRHRLPWRTQSTPWNILLAEVLLHRTRASQVEGIYRDVVKRFPSPESLVRKQVEWLEITQPVGLAWRARSFVSTCEQLVNLHENKVPSGLTALTSLPGIGHYIASAVRCFGFGYPEVVVDTNTVRLACRITGEPLNPANHRSRRIREVVSRLSTGGTAPCAEDNYALLDLAALVCHPKIPDCKECPLVLRCNTGSRVLSDTGHSGTRR